MCPCTVYVRMCMYYVVYTNCKIFQIVNGTVFFVFDLLALKINIDVTYSGIYNDTFMVHIKPSALIESDRQYR